MIPIIVGNETLRAVASFVAANEMLPPNTRHTEQERLNQQALRSCSGSSSCSKTVSPSIYDLPYSSAGAFGTLRPDHPFQSSTSTSTITAIRPYAAPSPPLATSAPFGSGLFLNDLDVLLQAIG